jgi:two-component system response regulator GlrR
MRLTPFCQRSGAGGIVGFQRVKLKLKDRMNEVLIVDDERPTRELLVRWLAADGHTLHEAADPDAALRILSERSIAVVTIDKDMPGHDGTWLVEQIQARYPAVAMLLATGDDSIPPRIHLSRGVQGYLVKPFKRELVTSAASDAIAWHTVAAQAARQSP